MTSANLSSSSTPPTMSGPSKKQRRDDDKPPAEPPKSSLAHMARRRVWRACESCRRKKIKCDGTEPICGQCSASNANCTWIQTRDRAALSRHYVQELENRLLKLESILTRVAPNLDLNNLPSGPITISAATSDASPSPAPVTKSNDHNTRAPSTPADSLESRSTVDAVAANANAANGTRPVRSDVSEEFVIEQMGSLALDDHGHLRWIGGSSTMSLIEAFRNFSGDTSDRDMFTSSTSPPETPPNINTPTPNPPSANVLYFPSSLQFGKVRALPRADEVEFPPRDLADKLVDAYFYQFHHTLPVLDSISFKKRYVQLMSMREKAAQAGVAPEMPSTSDAGFLSVVFSVFAVAARFVKDERLLTENVDGEDAGGMGMVYYERAMILYYIGATATQLAHVQAFVLLSSFLASLNCLPQSWLLCGQAVRVAQDLGLHRSPKHLVMSLVNKETRRRVWWCVYGLDRMLAVALGRPLGIEDSDCDVEMPIPIDDHELPAYFASLANSPSGTSSSSHELPNTALPNSGSQPPALDTPAKTPSLMSGFIALTELYRIAGKILRTVYAVNAVEVCKENVAITQANVEKLDKELNAWCEKLPPTFKSDPKSVQEVTMGAILCSSYYSALITLHRNFLPTRKKGTVNPNWSSVPKAVFASRSCILLSLTTKDAIPPSHHLAFFVQALFGAAVIILLCARFATVESAARTATEEVNTSLKCLGALENLWPGAQKCKELLQDLAEITKGEMRVSIPVNFGKNGVQNSLPPVAPKPLVPSIPASVPVPPPVEMVQTKYSSFKRAAPKGNESEQPSNPSPPASVGPSGRKIKPKPRERLSMSGSISSMGQIPISPTASSRPSTDMDYQFLLNQSPPRTTQASNVHSTSAAVSPEPALPIYATTPDSKRNSHSPTQGSPEVPEILSSPNGTTFTFPPNNPQRFSGQVEWNMPGQANDPFQMQPQFHPNGLFSSIPMINNGGDNSHSPPHLPQPAYNNYPYDMTSHPPQPHVPNGIDLSASGLPFSGFDWLQNFGAGTGNGFGAGDVAAWQNFVQTGIFNDMPDQPFSLVEGNGMGDTILDVGDTNLPPA